jgi:hypothetical protein
LFGIAARNISTGGRDMADPLTAQTIDTLAEFVERTDLEKMRIVPNSKLPVLLRTGAVTIGHRVFFRAGRFHEDTPRGLAHIAHESIHIGQYGELGLPRFLGRYLLGAIRTRFSHARHPMEIDLIARQRSIRTTLEAREND